MEKIIIAGGTGFLGNCLKDHYKDTDTKIVILTRNVMPREENIAYVHWNGRDQGAWSEALEGADVLINLTGRSVDCRYNKKNKAEIYSSRLDSTTVLGLAIARCENPPRLWINSSSATIYRHSLDRDMDEYTGEAGTGFSVDVCQRWEKTFLDSATPGTRKVIIRTAIVLGKKGGALKPLTVFAKTGLGGPQGRGDQYVSWVHEKDFVSIIDFIIAHEEIQGVYNLAAPNPIPNKEFMKILRQIHKVRVGMPMPAWLLTAGALLIRTEPELVLKSRRVVPTKLLASGYRFHFADIRSSLTDLAA